VRKNIADGNGRIKIGKEALDFGLYRFLAKQMLKSGSKDNIFAHTFMILCWNLMCRAGNLTSVCFSHLEWKNDAMGIYFAHMKNDQTGERPRDARHIYANPLAPEISPLLALGIYWLCYPIDENVAQLFPGGCQYDRFRKILCRLGESNEGRNTYSVEGSVPTNCFGTDEQRDDSSSNRF
jgi:hypothetical protein